MPDIAIFRPKVTDDVLYNPHIGFQTFQHFNGDASFAGKRLDRGRPGGVRPDARTARPVPSHPYSTVAYCRWYWDQIEPKDGQFRWDIIDGALATASDRGQTLAIRVDVPRLTGRARRPRVVQEDRRQRRHVRPATRAATTVLAARLLATPSTSSTGPASTPNWPPATTATPTSNPSTARPSAPGASGPPTPSTPPCGPRPRSSTATRKLQGRRRSSCSSTTPPRCATASSTAPAGAPTASATCASRAARRWCHMFDCYPQGIVYGGAVDAWQTRPVIVRGLLGDGALARRGLGPRLHLRPGRQVALSARSTPSPPPSPSPLARRQSLP